MRIHCALREAAKAKTFIRFGSEKSRNLVRAVLEPYPLLGLRTQDIYHTIHERFPDKEEKDCFLPPDGSPANHVLPPKLKHPIRSMSHLKCTVLPEMVGLGEIDRVFIKQGASRRDEPRLDRVTYRMGGVSWVPTDIKKPQEWRWRLNPNYEPKELPDPDIATVMKAQTPRVAGGRKAKSRVKEERLTSQKRTYGRTIV
ncbi:hypothetical protein HHX47_DHR5000139 [Lentinula edodes]|nr:hypothetical protein HHX47_DHR5000139 [Lentinula edodes]